MFYFYILKSIRDKKLYVGFSEDLQRRFQEHNKGKINSTKNRQPFKLIYYEAYKSEKDARNRERQIKRRANALISLKHRLINSLE